MIRVISHGVKRGGSRSIRPGLVWTRVLACALSLAAGVVGGDRPALAAPERTWGLLADSLAFLDAASGVSRARFGLLAVSLDRGDTLLAIEPDRRFIPASNIKLFTAGAFLKQLGP